MEFMNRLKVGLVFLVCVTGISTSVSGQGIMFPALGPVNRSMGGASVAAPLDAVGSLHWNPAAISGLGSSELEFGIELLLANIDTTSAAGPFAGTTGAEAGVVPIPSIGWVHQSTVNPRLTYGLGVYSVGGFQTNYPASEFPGPPSNPIFTPQLGFGRIFSSAEFLQLVPTVSYAVTDRLSIGFAPVVTMGRIELSPFVLAPPSMPGAPPSSGQGNRWHWGGGAQLGIYYIADNCWHLGASIKSPTWFERFRFLSENPDGSPRVVSTELELPMIISVGAAYSGYENLVLAMDVRYFGYEDTKLFGDAAVFAANGQLLGLGWDDTVSVSVGAQYRLNDCTDVRAGYSYNTNPIHSTNAAVNVATPLIYEHIVNFGLSRQLTDCAAVNLSFTHALDNTVNGPLPGGAGIFSNSLSVYTIALGTTVRY